MDGEITTRSADIGPVARKIHAVMSEVEKVGKDRKNEFQKYKYAGEADVVKVIRAAMVNHGLVAVPNLTSKSTIDAGATKSGTSQWLTEITVEYTMIDIETGSFITASFAGAGIDSGDKGLYKAFTGCNKYFLLKSFQIETDDDPEKESPERQPSRFAPKNDPIEFGKQKGRAIARIGQLESQALDRGLADENGIDDWRLLYAGNKSLAEASMTGDKSLTAYGTALNKLLSDAN